VAESPFAEPSPGAAPTAPAVRVRHLTVTYPVGEVRRAAVRDVSLDVAAGAITGITGESGSGKSTLAMALLHGVPSPGRIEGGSVEIEGLGDILALRGEALRRVRGREVGFVFQAAQNSLNPLKPVGAQVLDVARSHGVRQPRQVLQEARALLTYMGLDADRVLLSYQHELSGGMRQRVNIAFALLLRPRVVVLDEPTTALDMLSQWQVLRIVRELHQQRHLTTLVVTHDLGVVAELADQVAVMYAGQVVEQGPVAQVLRRPLHPYTQGLLQAIPRLTGDPDRARSLPGSPPNLLTIPEVGCVFRHRCPWRMAICDTKRPSLQETAPGHAAACWQVNPS
jgi:peptide/nickel transport system ATP-binding protein